jgi:hypothetical protein
VQMQLDTFRTMRRGSGEGFLPLRRQDSGPTFVSGLLLYLYRQHRTAACMQRSEDVAHAQSARWQVRMLYRGFNNA